MMAPGSPNLLPMAAPVLSFTAEEAWQAARAEIDGAMAESVFLSDYPRLPVVEVVLQRALDKIVQARGNTAFVYDWAKKPARLDVSFNNEVSWSGTKR